MPARRSDLACLVSYRAWLDDLPDLDFLLWKLRVQTHDGMIPLACWCGTWNGRGEPGFVCHAVSTWPSVWPRSR